MNDKKELVGIYIENANSNGNLISGNKIHSLNHIREGRPSLYDVAGLYLFVGYGQNLIEKNFIHSLNIQTANSGEGSHIRAIQIVNGKADIQNNMIRHGIDQLGNIIQNCCNIEGISIEGSLTNLNIAHNLICITGYLNREVFSKTATIHRKAFFGLNLFNKILFNNRFNGIGFSEHYCILLSSANSLTSNNNLFFVSELNGIIASKDNGNTKFYILQSWIDSTKLDLNSLVRYPNFINHMGNKSSIDLHSKSPSPVESKGLFLSNIPNDFDNGLRANLTPTDIGADARNFVFGFPVPAEDDNTSEIVKEFHLYQNFPNPFNPSTTISWQLPVSGKVTIKLYDLLGREIETIVDGYFEAGKYRKLFNINYELPSGVYLYQMKSENFIEAKKLMLLK